MSIGGVWQCAAGAILTVVVTQTEMARAQAAASYNTSADVTAITTIETTLDNATDMKGLIGYYAPDALVLDMTEPGIYQGRKQIDAAFTKQFAGVASIKPALQDMNIASDGRFACVAQRVSFHTVMKDGSTFDLSQRQLDALKKIDGKWQIIQEQISVPSDPKTGMAVTNAGLKVRGQAPWSATLFDGPATTPAKADAEIRDWVVTNSPIVDVDKMVQVLGPGGLVVMYDLTTPGEYRGQAEIRTAYAPLMNSLTSAKVQLLKFVVDSDGVFAAQADTQNLQINFKNGTSKVITYRESDCYHRVGGQWKSFAESLSFPFDPKTGKSITDDAAARFK